MHGQDQKELFDKMKKTDIEIDNIYIYFQRD